MDQAQKEKSLEMVSYTTSLRKSLMANRKLQVKLQIEDRAIREKLEENVEFITRRLTYEQELQLLELSIAKYLDKINYMKGKVKPLSLKDCQLVLRENLLSEKIKWEIILPPQEEGMPSVVKDITNAAIFPQDETFGNCFIAWLREKKIITHLLYAD